MEAHTPNPDAEYVWYNDVSRQFLRRGYLPEGQTLDERVWEIGRELERRTGIDGIAAEFVANMKRGWYSLSTPVWCNYATDRGSPISCFGSFVEDSIDSIAYTDAEITMMSKGGGGTSAYLGKLRGRGSPIKGGLNGESNGAVSFARKFDTTIDVTSQGTSRRGNCAVYLDITHPDIHEFLQIKHEGSPIQRLNSGVCVPDAFMERVEAKELPVLELWAKVLDSRLKTGLPYIFFTDTVNRDTVEAYKDHWIYASQMCTEIALPSNKSEAFVCCLASMNIAKYDEWKDDPRAIFIMVALLDTVISEFIEKNEDVPFMERAVRFARRHRALGLGWLGWHTYLQQNMVAFESMEAKLRNVRIAKHIKDRAYEASAALARMFGEPEMLKGVGRRNTTLLAIAPTKSSATILGQMSEGIEPHHANYFVNDKAKVKYSWRNPELRTVLRRHGKDAEETWMSILDNDGSVQHLTFLTDHEREVFKTLREISPREIVIQAAGRQKHIDQAQSLNLLIDPTTPAKEVNELILFAWRQGVKALYYQINRSAAREFVRNLGDCSSCEA